MHFQVKSGRAFAYFFYTFSSDSSSSFFVTDPCDPNPCSNGSTCQADGASYTCQCAEGLYGKNCEYGKSNISKLIYTPTCFHFLLLTLYLASAPYERFEGEVYFYYVWRKCSLFTEQCRNGTASVCLTCEGAYSEADCREIGQVEECNQNNVS